MSNMGPPHAASMLRGASVISIQHERLILELLPFKDSSKFQEWLHGDFVRGSWLEFYRSYLTQTTDAAEPDKTQAAQAARDAINSRSQKYLVYHPDKTNWTAEEHHVRFIVTVIQDNMLKALWSESEWKKKGIEITKAVFEVLCYLKSAYLYAEQNPPSYKLQE